MPNLYDILGLAPGATAAEVRAAHRRLVKTTHPDAGGSAEAFAAVQRAYEVLIDPEARRLYDETGCVDGDSLQRQAEAAARNAFGEAMGAALQAGGKVAAPRQVAQALRSVHRQVKAAKEKAANVDALRQRLVEVAKGLRRPDPATAPVLETQIVLELAACDRQEQQAQHDLAVAERAAAILQTYERADETKNPTFYVSTGYNFWSVS